MVYNRLLELRRNHVIVEDDRKAVRAHLISKTLRLYYDLVRYFRDHKVYSTSRAFLWPHGNDDGCDDGWLQVLIARASDISNMTSRGAYN